MNPAPGTKQGRIRIASREDASFLWHLLKDHRSVILEARAVVESAGGDTHPWTGRVQQCRRLMEEVSRTQREMGWLDDQSERSHP